MYMYVYCTFMPKVNLYCIVYSYYYIYITHPVEVVVATAQYKAIIYFSNTEDTAKLISVWYYKYNDNYWIG